MNDLYARAAIIPGRSCTRSKSPDRLLRAWAERGWAAEILDTDGRKYIDMVCGLGAISLGYNYSASAYDNADMCGVYSLPHRVEVEAAEAVLGHVAPWATAVRFMKSGSEACTAAYMVAKKFTGRPDVLMGDWAYHGWHPWTEQAERFGHGEDLNKKPISWAEKRIAAVFIEPHRWEPVDVGWLKSVRAFCDRIGALMVFDSMIYGARYDLRGASGYFGVQPDLECFGKGYSNGASCAFVTGKEALETHGEISSGTYSGDTTGLSALVDTIDIYTTRSVIPTIWARGRQLVEGLKRVIPLEFGTVEGHPPHCRIRFNDPQSGEPYDYRASTARPLTHKFKDGMAKRGVLVYPDWLMVMYAHTEQQINQVIEAAGETAKELLA